MLLYGVFRGNFARSQPSVQLEKSFVFCFSGVFFDCLFNHRVVVEKSVKLLVAAESQSTQKHRRGEFTRFVDFYPEYTLSVLLVFEPCASIGYNGSCVYLFTRFCVHLEAVVNARASYKLRDYNSFRSVDYKRTVFGHFRQVAHEYFGIDNAVGNLIYKSYLYF